MKTLSVFDPFVEFDRLFEGLPLRGRQSVVSGNTVPLDIYAKDGNWVVKASLPGVSPENIDVSIERGVLTIKGELNFHQEHEEAKIYRREIASGSFVRSVRLPENADVDKVEASFENGFVTISIPRLGEDKPESIKVPVKALGADSNKN